MHYRKPVLAGITLLISGLFACDSNEIGESKDVNQDKIYIDYQVSYTEGDDQVYLSLQYRFAGSAGTTLVLNNPSQAELDGEKLKVDSSDGSGAFYEINKNYKDFLGKHSINFKDINGRHFENSFEFVPFTINTLPEVFERNKNLVISFNTAPLGSNDYIAIASIDTDSSFYYQQAGTSSNVIIPLSELKRQQGKTLSFESTIHRDIPLSQTTPEGGTLRYTYRLKPVKIKLQP
jgi:hypothetical protein